jgi:hypothetical protein
VISVVDPDPHLDRIKMESRIPIGIGTNRPIHKHWL